MCQVRAYLFWVPLRRCHSLFPSDTQESNEKGSYILNMQPYSCALKFDKEKYDFLTFATVGD